MGSKMIKVLGLTFAIVAALAVCAFAEPMTDEERAEAAALNGKHYVPVEYTSEQFAQTRELQAELATHDDVNIPAEHAYVAVAYDTEDYTEARAIAAAEEHESETPFAEVQHVAQK